MGKRQSIIIQGHTFATRKAAEAHVRALLSKYAPRGVVSDPADHDFLLALLDRHPEAQEKRGPGVARFHVQPNATNPRNKSGEYVVELKIERINGTEIDVSWRFC